MQTTLKVKKLLSNLLSVDCVIFGFNFERLNVLLLERTLRDKITDEIEFSDLTLTGDHVYENETIEKAAHRVLFDLTGLSNIYLKQFKAFTDPERISKPNDQRWIIHQDRNPEQRVVSIGFYSLLATQDVKIEYKGRSVKWFPVSEVGELAFDHNNIIDEALKALRREIRYKPIAFELLPNKFTLTQLQSVYEIILDTKFDTRNFRKKTNRMKYLIPLDEKQTGVAHKPARLYTFSRDIYNKTKQELLDFLV